FMLKDAAPEELHAAILRLAAGETLIAPVSAALARASGLSDDAVPAHLTAREIAILRLVAGGYSNKEIGRALHISDGTVKNHLTEILARLDARDRTHAVLKAIALKQF
ncbi:MAG: response regulator transcription factor, partial [Stenotrophobium sp.]